MAAASNGRLRSHRGGGWHHHHHHQPVVVLAAVAVVIASVTQLFGTSDASRLSSQGTGSPCYEVDEQGNEDLSKPQKCMPAFENVVAGKMVNVTPVQMTCGLRVKTEYCIQTHGIYRECDVCDDTLPDKRHPPEYLTDIHEDFNQSWWQSVTMLEDVHTTSVNLTVHLGKAYDITYVRLKFHSPRPASFAIYKKNRKNPARPDDNPDEGWIPWQYYSATCRDTYQMPDSLSIIQPRDGQTKINEDRALCTSEFSDMTPLSGANVPFSTLEGRPSGYNFEYSPELQQWVSATDIRISLQRLNTFGDEVFGDHKVLKSYYYAITDLTVGGRCQCNGHATHCIESSEDNEDTTMVCLCQHGTDGPNCETCLQDHWDVPWRRATSQSANECKPCECNGWSNRCRFNEQLYQERGRGGECLNCDGNRDGPNCERCKPNHFFSPIPDEQGRVPCEPCNCNAIGSVQQQCGPDGRCECKPGVTGDKCDQCEATHWNFNNLGCENCGCLPEGSLDNNPRCDPTDGTCLCKQNVEGKRCDRCQAGHFYIDEMNEFGCTPCFCFGHSSECRLSPGYTKASIRSEFSRGDEDWRLIQGDRSEPLKFDGYSRLIAVQSTPGGGTNGVAYFSAPEKYLGDQRASYNQNLEFKLRINNVGARPSMEDIIIEGGGARTTRIALSITDQGNPVPRSEMQEYKFRLHENPEFSWSPRLSSNDFIAILANVTALKIRGTYLPLGVGFLDEVRLGSAEKNGDGQPAYWIEDCNCPKGFEGQFCEKCQEGFYHEKNRGPFARCVPCSCNNHAPSCDRETGKCACQDFTAGHNCEQCARGYYGNALEGTPNDCQPCPCPEGGACVIVPNDPNSPLCTECPEGRTGPRCELCKDGWFGDPMGMEGPVRECRMCDCNNNVDPNAIGNCNRTTGECLRCIDNTAGFNCERCKSGFFGDALALKKPGDPPSCQPCQCYPVGTNLSPETFLPICNGYTGECSCKNNVVGRDCDRCANGYFNLDSGEGCEPCNCDSVGSINATCHVQTGQCFCQEGVTGQRCDMCLPYHYGFSSEGCKPCDCDPTGATELQCDLLTGQCPCREKVEGRKCDRCMENTRSKDTGGYGEKICEPCDDCYNLVKDAVDKHRANLRALDDLLQQLAENPEPIGTEFEYELRRLQVRVKAALADARISSQSDDGGTLRDQLEDLRVKLQEVIDLVTKANTQLNEADREGKETERNVDQASEIIERARESLKNAQRQLDTQGREALMEAQERSKKFGEESQKMSSIAREARLLAEQQVEDANEISSIAKEAYEISNEAYQIARDALEEQHHTANKITVLEVQVNDLKDKLRAVQSLASQTLKDATTAHDQALSLSQEARSLEVPNPDFETLNDQADKLIREAQRIEEEANRIINENQDLITESQEKRRQFDDLIRRAENQNQMLESQLQEVTDYQERGLKAVEMGNNVLSDARKTLETLEDFESRVSENQEAAKEAMAELPAIRDMIKRAEEKANQTLQAIDGAEVSANLALSVSKDAEKIAEDASGKVDEINEDIQVALEESQELSTAAESLAKKLEETQELMESKEEAGQEDGETALEALSKANQAEQKAESAMNKVEQAKRELENIAAILSNVEEPEPGLLEELTRRVEEAEAQIEAQDLDQRLKELEASKQKKMEALREYERELKYMREEIENIKAIEESLPTFCPKSNELCLEDQC